MFFFIGGVQPRTVTLDERKRMCDSCGLHQARLARVDHYLSLFFIPLFPVKKGQPVILCDRCGRIATETGEPVYTPSPSGDASCAACGRPVEKTFRFCPGCGKPLSRSRGRNER